MIYSGSLASLKEIAAIVISTHKIYNPYGQINTDAAFVNTRAPAFREAVTWFAQIQIAYNT